MKCLRFFKVGQFRVSDWSGIFKDRSHWGLIQDRERLLPTRALHNKSEEIRTARSFAHLTGMTSGTGMIVDPIV